MLCVWSIGSKVEIMVKILIVSDTHRKDDGFWTVFRKEAPIDMLIHCGDSCGSEKNFKFRANCECHFVNGNCDSIFGGNTEQIFEIGKHKVFLTHGHRYGVRSGEDELVLMAKAVGADIVMYGHTHIPMIKVVDGIYVVNPGSLGEPRQENKTPSYIIMTIDDEQNVNFELKYI